MNGQTVFINMLGEFTIKYGDKTISDQANHSKKIWNILEYLITCRNKEVSQNDLIELLWEDEGSTNPNGALKTLMHRVRNLLKDLDAPDVNFIVQSRGAYAWNNAIPCVVDTDEFERLYKEGLDAEDSEVRLSLFRKAITVYKGDFLPKTSHETWVIPLSAYYHTMYLKLVHETIAILTEQQAFEDIANICWHAITIDQFDEDLHYQLIYALYRSDNRHAALKQYSTTTDLFFEKFGITPSAKLKELYREIIKTSKDIETDLNTIKDNLREQQKKTGAFFCEYEFFKDIYRLEARSAERSGVSIYLCLMTITNLSGEQPPLNSLSKAMDKLKNCIFNSLRSSDIFSRYSVSQYILMLPTTSYESGERVLKRIASEFQKYNNNDRIMLQYKLQPLDPIDKSCHDTGL